jgi:hypothetical protein
MDKGLFFTSTKRKKKPNLAKEKEREPDAQLGATTSTVGFEGWETDMALGGLD